MLSLIDLLDFYWSSKSEASVDYFEDSLCSDVSCAHKRKLREVRGGGGVNN